jgi:S-adenosylmethionine:tRNA ribosyltransferase-isomerase
VSAAEHAASVLARVARERREAHEPPEARGLRRDEVRMLVAAGAGMTHARACDLPDHLRAGDVLVVNTSATLPAALPVRRADGTSLRLHLSTPAAGCGAAAAPKPPEAADVARRTARLHRDGEVAGAEVPEPADVARRIFGLQGDGEVAEVPEPESAARWIVELRRDGERFGEGRAGEVLALPGGAHATLLAPYLGRRLWLAELDPPDLLAYLARHGAPIRYAHTRGEHPLDAYQTIFALHPGSAEMPSAGRPFTPELVTALTTRGVVVAPITLHAGVASLEAGETPYPERFAVAPTTARLVNAARAGGGRIIAVGTTVVRALETVALPFGHVEADAGWTHHVVTPETGVRVVDGLLTGWHDPDASHLLMLEAIGGRALVERSYAAALDAGYRWHEFGDVHLIAP